jgi:hypothetical protein
MQALQEAAASPGKRATGICPITIVVTNWRIEITAIAYGDIVTS